MTEASINFTHIRDLVEKCRLPNLVAVNDVLEKVRQGQYTIILGPRFSEKSFLLEDIAGRLRDVGYVALAINLEPIGPLTGASFLRHLASEMANAAGLKPEPMTLPGEERTLQDFLEELPATLNGNVVLLFDHLEAVPANSIRSLLNVLRATQTRMHAIAPAFTICAVAASTFEVADISLGPVSPFNAAPIWVRDLDLEETVQLAATIAVQLGVEADADFPEQLYSITNGDRYAVARLFKKAADRTREDQRRNITVADLDAAVRWFLENAETEYPPLHETMRLLEREPRSLIALTAILQRGSVPQKELQVDRPEYLRLTGAVAIAEPDRVYGPRSELYRRFLARRYQLPVVSRVLCAAGLFHAAIDYIGAQPVLQQTPELRTAFFEAIVGSLYATRELDAGVARLANQLHDAFEVAQAAVWLSSADRSTLEPVSQFGYGELLPKRVDSDSVEAVAFSSAEYELRHEGQVLGMPLCRRDDERIGVVVVSGFTGRVQDEKFSALRSFVQQIGWALGSVIDFERRVEQLERLQSTSLRLAQSLDLREVLVKTVQECRNAIVGAQRGLLMLYRDDEKRLIVEEQEGFRATFKDEVVLTPGDGSYAATVFESGNPMRIDDAPNDRRVKLRSDPDIAKQQSVVCVPLSAWGRPIGVFIVDSITEKHAFRSDDERLLAAFAAQAATAIQNARIYRELYELSIAISERDVDVDEIFRRAARSIVRVTGAAATNVLLLRDADEPDLAVAQDPVKVIAQPSEFAMKPRPDGMTVEVLKTKKPVLSSETANGINPDLAALGVKETIALPLSLPEDVLGVLYIHFDRPHVFSGEEIRILSLFANECAVAIERSQHAEQRRVHASVAWMGIDLSEMGHEITQQVAILNNNLYLLKKSLDPEQLATLQKADEAAKAIAAVPMRPIQLRDDVRPRDIVAFVHEQMDRWCSKHPIDVELTDLGPPTMVCFDRNRMEMVLKHMAKNAVRAAKLAPAPRLSVRGHHGKRSVSFNIANNGPRIPPEIQSKLFLDLVPSGFGGMGAGLLISRSIVRGYGGDLELVISNDDETMFRLWFPIHKSRDADRDTERIDD